MKMLTAMTVVTILAASAAILAPSALYAWADCPAPNEIIWTGHIFTTSDGAFKSYTMSAPASIPSNDIHFNAAGTLSNSSPFVKPLNSCTYFYRFYPSAGVIFSLYPTHGAIYNIHLHAGWYKIGNAFMCNGPNVDNCPLY